MVIDMTPGFDPDALRRLRISSSKSLRVLAQELDVSHQAVGHWETGRSTPGADQLPALALALDCRIDDLFILATTGG